MSKTAAIIGGGVIGGGWLARFLLNGWDVRLHDPDPEAERKVGAVLAGARRALPMLYDRALPPEGRLTLCGSVAEAVAGADWVQESVPERLDLKHRVLAEITAHAPRNAVIGSSTSGFTPSQLQEGLSRPGAVLVAHPFNPVYLLPLVELVPSAATRPEVLDTAKATLTGLGMFPLHVRAEIDAHIADRLLEAVWREALWLVKDGIATTGEIDEAIRMGFGLRWAQMGLFETYRIAGGEAGMKHFMAQFGPALKWPWTKLMDVPEFTDDLVELIAGQSDAQSGHMGIRELERLRDDNLVAMLRALRQRDAAAGALLNAHEAAMAQPLADTVPLITVRRTVPVDWTDYNGHMNEGRYGQVFSDAADAVMAHVGADAAYIAGGNSYFTVETSVKYLFETHAGEAIEVATRVTTGAGKKLGMSHEMRRAADGALLATCTQFLLHVSLETRKSCPPQPEVLARVEALAAAHREA
ncbi:L-carnitine dehydrogenase [Pseudoruegeria aquimaris]|uniref:L-carnitine dehydrogenase n=1 Tax=Pseudoruegeria aquimaris TaxID=393663 RepID=A0A1Y5SG83_9RHOB|nr:carnitine 3-dehydrogenase [Pseudoruegeria aquimaris]SLN40101.1 L-carnitine dehydrogenase [Pseudoruegeria aquimaris]